MEKIFLEDFQIWPGSTPERAVHPNNISSLDAHTQFISHTWTIVLVGEPGLAERCGLVDLKVSAIHCNLARSVSISTKRPKAKPILPTNLTIVAGSSVKLAQYTTRINAQ